MSNTTEQKYLDYLALSVRIKRGSLAWDEYLQTLLPKPEPKAVPKATKSHQAKLRKDAMTFWRG